MTRILSAPRQRVQLQDILADHEPSYRSRGEAQIGRLLDRYGIPFQYEAPLQLDDQQRNRTWHPDFTLPRDDYAPLILEYAGMPDKPDYMAGLRHKEKTYAENRFDAMLIYPQDLQGPAWSQRLYNRVRQAYERPRPAMRYPATSLIRASYARPNRGYRR